MFTKVLIADPIVLNNRDPEVYTSARTPKEIVESMGGLFVEGPIANGFKLPAGKTAVFSYQPNLTPKEIDAELDNGYAGVIVAAKAVTNPKAKFAVRIGAGTNNVQAIADAGGVVMNTPGFNSRPTAQAMVYALNELLSWGENREKLGLEPTNLYRQTRHVLLDNHLANSSDLSAYYHGGWPQFSGPKTGPKKIAIIGAGHIGGLVAEMLLPDGHDIVTYSRSNTKQAANPVEAARDADVIIVQTPLTDTTRGMINAEVFKAAKRNVVLVNAARAEVVDIPALRDAVLTGHVGGLIVDVDCFPHKQNSPMQPYIDIVRQAERDGFFFPEDRRIILTPHTFADTHSPSREVGGMQAIREALRAIAIDNGLNEPYINRVNGGRTTKEDGLKTQSLHPMIAAALNGGGLQQTRGLSEDKKIIR